MERAFEDVFDKIHPGFFEQEYIKNRPAEIYSEEMLLELSGYDKNQYVIDVPEKVSFGYYKGTNEKLKESVAQVEESWVQFFSENSRVYCAMAGDEIASFCLIENFGSYPYCQTAHCGRCKPHFIFGGLASPIVPYRYLTQTTDGITADCRSFV